jgi:tRNA (uracil-5-)-methyltransferase
VATNISRNSKDILELHCGLGTFTIPLSHLYRKVLATENSRPSIQALNDNIFLNNRKNIYSGRLSGKETLEALQRKRNFRRLQDIDLDEFEIKTIFLDPPREGLDVFTIQNLINVENIIYISCGFESFKRDLKILQKTHRILDLALFDQFPYTDHIESGAILKRIAPI